MEKHKFVFESFNDFLKNVDPLLEKKKPGTELTLDGAQFLVEKIIELDLALAENSIKKSDASTASPTKIYGPKVIEAAGAEEYGKAAIYAILADTGSVSSQKIPYLQALGIDIDPKASDAEKKKKIKEFGAKVEDMSDADAMKLAEASLKVKKEPLAYRYRTIVLWGMLSEADKAKVYNDFFKLALKRGYDTVEGLDGMIDKHYKSKLKENKSSLTSPGVLVFLNKEEIQKEEPALPTKKDKTFLLDDEKAAEVFKPNKTGANGQEDFMEKTFDELVGKLGSVFERFKAGEITTITKISILTSADRYRNTLDAEKLSWGELAYSRAIAMSKLIEGMASAAGLDDDIISLLPKLTTIYAKGANGDGTSGPNPPEGKKFGYYVSGEDGAKWIEGTDRNIVTIIPIDEQGTPTAKNADGAKTVKMEPETDVTKYNQYRYNNIEIEFERVEIKETGDVPTSEKVVALKYPVKILIPGRYTTTTIRIPIPTISKSSSSSGKNLGGQCPSFAETTKTKYGLTFKTINVLTYKSDQTKDLF